MASFNFKDAFLTITPALLTSSGAAVVAVPAGAPFRIFSATKLTGDPGGKTSYMKGFSAKALAVLIQTAEGKLDIECSNASEVQAARAAIGGVYSSCMVQLTLARTFMVPTTFLFSPATWENGGLFDGSDSGGWTDKISIKFTDALQDLVSIYSKTA